jgi:IS1 family transposase
MGGSRRTVDLCGEKNEACWLWWAIDLGSKQVCGWALGDRSPKTAERLDAQLPHAAQIKFCHDFWHPYGLIFQTQQHLRGKAHTFTIEKLEQSDSHLFGPPSAQDSLPQQIDKEPGRQHFPLPAPKMHCQCLGAC